MVSMCSFTTRRRRGDGPTHEYDENIYNTETRKHMITGRIVTGWSIRDHQLCPTYNVDMHVCAYLLQRMVKNIPDLASALACPQGGLQGWAHFRSFYTPEFVEHTFHIKASGVMAKILARNDVFVQVTFQRLTHTNVHNF